MKVGVTLGVLGSLALHGAALFYVAAWGRAPELGIEFQLPTEVEFGLTEGLELAGAPAAAAAADPPPAPREPEGATDPTSALDSGPRRPDAGRARDAGVDAGPTGEERVASAEGEEGGEGGEEGDDVATLPPGASIAIRIDMARIRTSPLAPDVRRFVQYNPHWRAIFDGSGVDPIDDFDRLMIASPNLLRERALFAGRATGGEPAIREVVERMATARGVEPGWRQVEGVPVATWANSDETERLVALVGPAHFTITRPDDLSRLLTVARVRAAQETEESGVQTDEASALLSMGERDYFTLEWEGYRRFFRGPAIPARLVGRIAAQPDGRIELSARAQYDSPEQAADARAFWERIREAYSRDVGVALIGLGGPLRTTEITAQGADVHGRMILNHAQVRLGLGLLGPMLEDFERRYSGRAPRPAGARPTGAQPTGAQPAGAGPAGAADPVSP